MHRVLSRMSPLYASDKGLLERLDLDSRRRQAVEKHPAVGLGNHPWIEDHHRCPGPRGCESTAQTPA